MSPSQGATGKPPDGGWGWAVLAAVGSCFFLGAGVSRCAGLLYTHWLREFGASSALTGVLASVVISSAHFSSPIGAVLCSLLGPRATMMLAGFLASLGVLLSSFGQNIQSMFVFHVIAGAGLGLSFTSGLVVLSLYFKRYYRAANGVASAGLGLGITAFPPLLQLLLDTYGWRGTLLVVSAIMANMCVWGALFRPLAPDRKRALEGDASGSRSRSAAAAAVDPGTRVVRRDESSDGAGGSLTAEGRRPRGTQRGPKCQGALRRLASLLGLNLLRRRPSFAFLCVINLLATMPYVAYAVYLVPWTAASAAGVSEQGSALVLSAFGAAGVAGRLVSGFLTNWRLSPAGLLAGAHLACAGGTLLVQVRTYGAFLASAGLVGLFTGVTQATTVVVVGKYAGQRNLGPAIGLCYFVNGIGDFLGPAIMGGIYDATVSYSVVFYCVAGNYALASALMACLVYAMKSPGGGVRLEAQNDDDQEVATDV